MRHYLWLPVSPVINPEGIHTLPNSNTYPVVLSMIYYSCEVIGDQPWCNAAEKLKHLDMCFDPVVCLFIYACFLQTHTGCRSELLRKTLASVISPVSGLMMWAGSPARSTSICSLGFRWICIVALRFSSSFWM